MNSRHTNPLKSILHPYVFVLKEGRTIKKDFLDYSLMILMTHSTETIHSPASEEEPSIPDACIEITPPCPPARRKLRRT